MIIMIITFMTLNMKLGFGRKPSELQTGVTLCDMATQPAWFKLIFSKLIINGG